MILAPVAAEVKPAAIFADAYPAPITPTPAEVESLDLAADFGPADDDAQWDLWAAEAECRDMMDAGLPTW